MAQTISQTKLNAMLEALWAKKTVTATGAKQWLPLLVHLLDTEKTIWWLYQHWLSPGQRRVLQGELSPQQSEQVIRFLGFIHDLGKATPAFQTKASYVHAADLDANLTEKLIRAGFDQTLLPQGDALIDRKQSPHNLAGEALLSAAGLNSTLAAIVGAHHGKPFPQLATRNLKAYTKNYYGVDDVRAASNLWGQLQQALIAKGLARVHVSQLSDLPELQQPQAVLAEGLLIMADWLASSTSFNNLPLFTLIDVQQNFADLAAHLEERFETAISNWSNNDSWTPTRVADVASYFKQHWNFAPRTVQAKMNAAIGATTAPGLFIVEAPMGIGKSEIALTAVEQLGGIVGANGLFFGLPTQATANAMFARLDAWLQRVTALEQLKVNVKLMHGKAQFNPEYQNIPRAENVADADVGVTVNGWFAGKKSILAEFTLGTIDQILLMSLKQRHLFLRHLGASGKVVVIDEVHAYDTYMSSYLKRALMWLGAYHVPVICLSATLPQTKRVALIEAYMEGRVGSAQHLQIAAPNWQTTQAYPLLTYTDGTTLHQLSEFDATPATQAITVKRLPQLTEAQLMKQVVQTIVTGGIAGVIVNTVKRAQALRQAVPDDVATILLHSAFLANDRSQIEQQLLRMIGKNAKRPHKLIVIGTQVLEQSLDIDFDVLFTDIAPMDLVLQRLGRLHRHQIKRPQALRQPTVYLLGIDADHNYGAANEAIYSKYLLRMTDHYLPQVVQLPTDIPRLVQAVYPLGERQATVADQEVAQALGDDVVALQAEFYEKIATANRKAKTFQIGKPKLRRAKSIKTWLKDNKRGIDVDENAAQAAVRDSDETLEVILLKQTAQGPTLLDGTPLTAVSSQVIAQQVVRLPHVLTSNLTSAIAALEKLTAQHFPEWQQDIWLRGMLCLPLTIQQSTMFNGYQLTYSTTLGLQYQKEDG